MSARTLDEQRARLVRAIHDNLASRLGSAVTLQDVQQAMFETHGLQMTLDEIADCLNSTLSDPDKGGLNRSIFSRHAQGRSTTSGKAHSLSQKAAEASHEAKMEGSAVSHGHAAACHADAATAHRNAARFHDQAEDFHQQRASGNFDAIEPDGTE